VEIDGVEVPVEEQTFGEIQGLPAPEEGVYYVVSTLVLTAAKAAGRQDVLAPDTAHAIRDAEGKIIGVPGFAK